MSLTNNPRVVPYIDPINTVNPEEIQIQIIEPEPPPLLNRLVRKTLYYTVGAVIEPQEPRYSAICVLFSLALAFAGGILVKRCF
jgi:hypothetical protein